MRVRITPWTATPPLAAARDVKWAEGLRGIASLLVVTSHLTRAFVPTLLAPAKDRSHVGAIFHLPFLRLPAQGPPWVALFFLLTGYVNAMKPMKQVRNGSICAALSGLSSSTLRRASRLVLPTTVATVASWIICQLGGYRIGKTCDADWVRETSPDPVPGIIPSIQSLVHNCFTTWSTGSNAYDPVQWTLPFLLKGSMLVYLTLLATVRTQSKYRMLVFICLYAFSWAGRDPMTGMNIYLGALLADISTEIASSTNPKGDLLSRILSWLLLLLGLHLSGYPEMAPEWATWSKHLAHVGRWIFPYSAEYWRYWPTIGAQLVTIAVLLSPSFQRFLSQPPLVWLGSLSFPIYLIHGPLIRSVLSWMLFGWRRPTYYYTKNEDGSVDRTWERIEFPNNWVFALVLPVFFVILLGVAHLWNLVVDPWCAWATRRLEEVMYGNGDAYGEKDGRMRSNNVLGGHSRYNSVGVENAV